MMNWRSRPLALFLPIAFLLLLEPERAWARGRGHGHGQHHGRHHPAHHHFFGFGHPYGYAQGGYGSPAGCGQTVVPGSPQPPAKEAPAARPPRGDAGEGRAPSKALIGGHHPWVGACALGLALLACPAWAWSGRTATGGMAGGALSRGNDEERSPHAGSTDGHAGFRDDPAGTGHGPQEGLPRPA